MNDAELAATAGMPPAVAAGFLAARRRDEQLTTDLDAIRAQLDSIGIDAAQGDPVRGQRVAEFNDLVVAEMARQYGDNPEVIALVKAKLGIV